MAHGHFYSLWVPQSHRHHYLAQFQQRPFASDADRKKIWAFDKKSAAVDEVAISSVALQWDYYAIETTEGQKHDKLEQELSKAESNAAKVLQMLRDKKNEKLELSDEQRVALVLLLAISRARVPAQRDASEEIAEMLGKHALAISVMSDDFIERARAAGIQGSDDEIRAFGARLEKQLEDGELKLEADQSWSLRSMAQEIETATPLLLERRLAVLRRSEPPFLLIGDNPVAMQGPDPGAPVGWATPGVRVLMPLAPDSLLLVTDDKGQELIAEGDAAEFDEARVIQWRQASRHVFAPSADQLLDVAARLGKDATKSSGQLVWGGWLPGMPAQGESPDESN